jgi:hypothetical protein
MEKRESERKSLEGKERSGGLVACFFLPEKHRQITCPASRQFEFSAKRKKFI